MKNNVLVIMKKEFARFFGDRRMLFTSLLMPGLLIYFLYSFMGSAINNLVSGGDNPPVYALRLPQEIDSFEGMAERNITHIQPEEVDSIKQGIQDGQIALLAVFPEDFSSRLASGQKPPPEVTLYYNSSVPMSFSLYQTINDVLISYQLEKNPMFIVNRGEEGWGDLAPPGTSSASSNIMASMLPMLMMLFIFSGCLSLAPESIAGEKERGTIATLLVTPVRAWVLAAGKILSLAVIALLCGLASSTGAVLGMARMMESSGASFNLQIVGVQDFLLLALIVLSTSFLFVAILSIISANSKSVKEANTTAMPLLLISALAGLLPMLGVGGGDGLISYFIPLYNAVQCLSELFGASYEPLHLIIAAVSNLLYATAGALVLARMFQSERIIMTK